MLAIIEAFKTKEQ